jgi:hypothetical protein
MIQVSLGIEFIRVLVVEPLATVDGIGGNHNGRVLWNEHPLVPIVFGDAMRHTQR